MKGHKDLGRTGGFTLIELLVVIAIISILAGLLLPALTSARQRAQSIVCRQRLMQFSMAQRGYAANNRGCPAYALNDADHYWWGPTEFLVEGRYIPWEYFIVINSPNRPAIRTMDAKGWQKSWGCPAENYTPTSVVFPVDLGINSRITWLRFHAVKSPTKLIFFGDTKIGQSSVSYTSTYWPCRHRGGDNFVFFDGHSEWWGMPTMLKCLTWSATQALALHNGRVYANGSPYPD